MVVVLLSVACGAATPVPARSSPIPSVSPTAVSSPSVGGPLLFAALEDNGANPVRPDTVVIAGLDGVARATATFQPVLPPPIGCLGTWLPPAAYVAAGMVFFADGNGMVRRLATSGGQAQAVTTFPISSQQILSFAVSPDGSKLLASVLTVPRMTSTDAACTGAANIYTGNFGLDVFSAQAGGSPLLLYHQDVPVGAPRQYPCILELAGWDQLGPVGVYPACLGPGGGPVRYPGTVVRVDAANGRVVNQVADPQTCVVQDIALNGDFVCDPPGVTADAIVRRPDGSEIWRFAAHPNAGYYYAFLSPDEQHVLARGFDAEVLGRDGTDLKLPQSLFFNGWLGSSAVITNLSNGNLAYATLQSPLTVTDLGFKGSFVGTVQT